MHCRILSPCFITAFCLLVADLAAQQPGGYSIPLLDLADRAEFQVVVDREPGQYLGHPTTLLLEDSSTMLTVYPQGHGRGPIVYQRSNDGGRSWSGRLSVPDNWVTSKETPTLHRVVAPDGTRRIIMFSGLYPIRMAHSEDDGESWSQLEPIGDFGGIVAMSSVVALNTGEGHYLAMFHDDGRFIDEVPGPTGSMTLYTTKSVDGGMTWSKPEVVYASSEIHLCEPGAFRSPDGKRIFVLLRENRRVANSHMIYSDDEGVTWSEPVELPASLTGDRHTGVYLPDGRLFISFRDMAQDSPTRGDWVAWVGSYEDVINGHEGEFRVRLMDNHKGTDCCYPGVELLPDGTVVTTTYGHWIEDEEPFIVTVRVPVGLLTTD